jgi:hypothetical protein
MYHLPIEITRMIYVFLGFFPCQGRLISFAKVQKYMDHKVQWYEEDKKKSLLCDYQNFNFRLHVTKDKKYIFGEVVDFFITFTSRKFGDVDAFLYNNVNLFHLHILGIGINIIIIESIEANLILLSTEQYINL